MREEPTTVVRSPAGDEDEGELYGEGDVLHAIGQRVLANFAVFMVCVTVVIVAMIGAATWSSATHDGQRLHHEIESRRLDLCSVPQRDLLCP